MKTERLSRILKQLPEELLMDFVKQTQHLDLESPRLIKEVWLNIINKKYPEGKDTLFEVDENIVLDKGFLA